MFKKSTLFVSTPIRKRMEEDLEFSCNPGLLKAMRLPQELIEAALTDDPPKAANWVLEGDCTAKMASYEAVRWASRIESTIRPLASNPDLMMLTILFFPKTNQERPGSIVVEIDGTGVIRSTVTNTWRG
jgi:hypothetical protein